MESRSFFERYRSTNLATDPLPVKVLHHSIWQAEVLGQALDWATTYLQQKSCPSYLISPLLGKVAKGLATTDLSHCVSGASLPSKRFSRNDEDNVDSECVKNQSYQPLKLMQAVAAKVDEICLTYKAELENIEQDFPTTALADTLGRTVHAISSWSIKNTRRMQEDRMVILPSIDSVFQLKGPMDYFAVFDGHSGVDAAAYSCAHLHRHLVTSPDFPEDMQAAFNYAFEVTDTALLMKCQEEKIRSGTTAVVTLFLPDNLWVAWAGDSQAVLIRNRKAMDLVSPHKPQREDEMERIRNAGGEVLCIRGTWRVNGNPSVSRAIGDPDYKDCLTSTPEINHVKLDGSEEFLILACDGLWDVIEPEDCIPILKKALLSEDPGEFDSVSKEFTTVAKQKGSQDNITVIVVSLKSREDLVKIFTSETMNGIDETADGTPMQLEINATPPSLEEIVSSAPVEKPVSPKSTATKSPLPTKMTSKGPIKPLVNANRLSSSSLPGKASSGNSKTALGTTVPPSTRTAPFPRALTKVTEKRNILTTSTRPPTAVTGRPGLAAKIGAQKDVGAPKPPISRLASAAASRVTVTSMTTKKPLQTDETDKTAAPKSAAPLRPRPGTVPLNSRLSLTKPKVENGKPGKDVPSKTASTREAIGSKGPAFNATARPTASKEAATAATRSAASKTGTVSQPKSKPASATSAATRNVPRTTSPIKPIVTTSLAKKLSTTSTATKPASPLKKAPTSLKKDNKANGISLTKSNEKKPVPSKARLTECAVAKVNALGSTDFVESAVEALSPVVPSAAGLDQESCILNSKVRSEEKIADGVSVSHQAAAPPVADTMENDVEVKLSASDVVVDIVQTQEAIHTFADPEAPPLFVEKTNAVVENLQLDVPRSEPIHPVLEVRNDTVPDFIEGGRAVTNAIDDLEDELILTTGDSVIPTTLEEDNMPAGIIVNDIADMIKDTLILKEDVKEIGEPRLEEELLSGASETQLMQEDIKTPDAVVGFGVGDTSHLGETISGITSHPLAGVEDAVVVTDNQEVGNFGLQGKLDLATTFTSKDKVVPMLHDSAIENIRQETENKMFQLDSPGVQLATVHSTDTKDEAFEDHRTQSPFSDVSEKYFSEAKRSLVNEFNVSDEILPHTTHQFSADEMNNPEFSYQENDFDLEAKLNTDIKLLEENAVKNHEGSPAESFVPVFDEKYGVCSYQDEYVEVQAYADKVKGKSSIESAFTNTTEIVLMHEDANLPEHVDEPKNQEETENQRENVVADYATGLSIDEHVISLTTDTAEAIQFNEPYKRFAEDNSMDDLRQELRERSETLGNKKGVFQDNHSTIEGYGSVDLLTESKFLNDAYLEDGTKLKTSQQYILGTKGPSDPENAEVDAKSDLYLVGTFHYHDPADLSVDKYEEGTNAQEKKDVEIEAQHSTDDVSSGQVFTSEVEPSNDCAIVENINELHLVADISPSSDFTNTFSSSQEHSEEVNLDPDENSASFNNQYSPEVQEKVDEQTESTCGLPLKLVPLDPSSTGEELLGVESAPPAEDGIDERYEDFDFSKGTQHSQNVTNPFENPFENKAAEFHDFRDSSRTGEHFETESDAHFGVYDHGSKPFSEPKDQSHQYEYPEEQAIPTFSTFGVSGLQKQIDMITNNGMNEDNFNGKYAEDNEPYRYHGSNLDNNFSASNGNQAEEMNTFINISESQNMATYRDTMSDSHANSAFANHGNNQAGDIRSTPDTLVDNIGK